MGSFSFSKNERLLNRADFVNLNRSGRRYHTRHFIVILKQNGLGTTRLGVTVSKKTGKAVRRNGIKRNIREFFRQHKSNFPQGYDIAIVTKKDAGNCDLHCLQEEIGEIVFDKRSFLSP